MSLEVTMADVDECAVNSISKQTNRWVRWAGGNHFIEVCQG